MTLDEIEAALEALPASPEDRDTILARAELARQRIELVKSPTVNMPPPLGATVTVNAPDGVGCVLQKSGHRYFYAEEIEGKTIIKMDWHTFAGLVASRDGGHLWTERNPSLVSQLNDFRL
jgi:hypothetical protein